MNLNDIELSAVPYEKCKKDLVEFRNRNRQTGRGVGYFDWRYLKRPSGRQPVIVWAVEKGSGSTIGSLSLIPHEYSVNGAPSLFGVLGDISVSESARGLGIAGRMLNYLHGLKETSTLRACIVLPNIEASRPLQKAGWQTKSRVERHIKILDIGGALQKKAGRALASIAAPPINLFLRLSMEPVRIPAQYKYSEVSAFDERFNELWANLPKSGIIYGRRDRKYLSWRFADHPEEKFFIFLLTQGTRPTGYIVYRVEEGAIKIYDLLCPEGGRESDYLLAAFSKHARSLSASSIIIRASAWALASFNLKKFGFLKRADTQNLMVRAIDTDGPEWGRWYLTAGDKDV